MSWRDPKKSDFELPETQKETGFRGLLFGKTQIYSYVYFILIYVLVTFIVFLTGGVDGTVGSALDSFASTITSFFGCFFGPLEPFAASLLSAAIPISMAGPTQFNSITATRPCRRQ